MRKSVAPRIGQNSLISSEEYTISFTNYTYISKANNLSEKCSFKKEYYMFDKKETKAEKTDTGGYIVKSKDGKMLTFLVE